MFVRRTPVTSRGKRYEYMHLVESYRRPSDGRPTHRVIANLGPFDQRTFDNLSLALAASKDGHRLVVAPRLDPTRLPKPAANLCYLDVAVLLELWSQRSLDSLLRDILPRGDAHVRHADVIAALVLQRCIEPDSKLAATRWFPHTALPELLGISPAQFNNTRVHRALDELERATPTLMARLPALYQSQLPTFAALFLDVTDTWFVGHGPDIAQYAKTKEGLTARKIGIVLLCNERGYPLRWAVVPGRCSDSVAMTEMLRAIARLPWARQMPVVMDRAMGNTAHIDSLLDDDIHLVTAITTPEFSRYAPQLPWSHLLELQPQQPADPSLATEAARRVEAAGMHLVTADLFVLDCGTVDFAQLTEPEPSSDLQGDDRVRAAMRACHTVNQSVADGLYSSYAAAGRALGLDSSVVRKYRRLGRLGDDLQLRILSGQAQGRTLAELLTVAKLPTGEAQQQAFDELLHKPLPRRPPAPAAAPPPRTPKTESDAPARSLRVVAFFNPARFVEQRWAAHQKVAGIEAYVRELNDKLQRPTCRLSRDRVVAKVYAKLEAVDLINAFRVEVRTLPLSDRSCLQVALELDAADYTARRRYDGFGVLVAHAELPHSPARLCQLYRSKDTVEKDFQCIKSLLELRPVRHQNEDKVRAHVTLCMLALLLERTLTDRLDGHCTAATALEFLDRVRLNAYRSETGPTLYNPNELDADHKAILRTLRMDHLGDDAAIAARLNPR